MELLAPVGSKESFITAIRGGANAVYMGMQDFHARKAASLLNIYDLEVLINHAHEKGVKVFLTLNTLIKHEEINAVVRSLAQVQPLQPDAIIIQDLGIAAILKNAFPDLPMHASTQMAVHNRMGVDFLAQQGFQRAILARELSFSELKMITKGSPIPIEIFCHGALCFSFSGMCLFSSHIGGASGNRGRCTQPCRRRWVNGDKKGYLLSPRDLDLSEHIGKLKKIGVASLKIEGRLRSSEYVYRTVTAYRLLIDASESDFPLALKEAKEILSGDMAREKTSCLFSGRSDVIFQPELAQCLGNRIGDVRSVSAGHLELSVDSGKGEILVGDRLRVSNPFTDTTIAFKIKELSKTQDTFVVPFAKAHEFHVGNPVYKTVDVAFDQKNIDEDIDAIYDHHARHNRRNGRRREILPPQTYTALISNKWKENKKMALDPSADDFVWVRFDTPAWLNALPSPGIKCRYVFNITKDNMRLSENLPDDLLPQMAGELPVFIGQREMPQFQKMVDKLISRGLKHWVINNVSHFGYFDEKEVTLIAGQFLYTWNAYAASFYADLGAHQVSASWEDDFLNIRKMCGPGLGRNTLVYLYGFPPLVRSRMIPKEFLSEKPIKSYNPGASSKDKGVPASFTPVFESEWTLMLPDKPINIFTARRKLQEIGINNFGIDLSFTKPNQKTWASLIEAYHKQENLPESIKFNFKRGVK